MGIHRGSAFVVIFGVCLFGCGQSPTPVDKPIQTAASSPEESIPTPVAVTDEERDPTSPAKAETPPVSVERAKEETTPPPVDKAEAAVIEPPPAIAEKKPVPESKPVPEARPEEPVSKPLAPPATFADLEKVIDFRKFPTPENATIRSQSVAQLYYEVPGELAKASDSLREYLTKAGVGDLKIYNHKGDGFENAAVVASKDGFAISASVQSRADNPGIVTVTASNLGNVDTRLLSVPMDAELVNGSAAGSAFSIAKPMKETVAQIRQQLRNAGWQEYEGPGGGGESTDFQFLTFIHNSITLSVYVAPNPVNKEILAINYSCGVLEHDFPIPPDAKKLNITPPILVCESSLDLASLSGFYSERYEALEWKQRKDDTKTGERFVRIVFQRGDDNVLFEALSIPGGTLLNLKAMDHKKLAESDRAFAKSSGKPISEPPIVDDSSLPFPIPESAKEIVFNDEKTRVEFRSADKPPKLIEFYQQAFARMGWNERKKDTVADDRSGHFSADKGDAKVFVNMLNLGADTEVSSIAFEITWKKPTEQSKEVPSK